MAWDRWLKRALLSKSYRKCPKYLKKSHRTSDLWRGVLCGSFYERRYISRDQDSGFGEMADYIGLLVPPERVSLTYLITWKWPCLPSSYNLPSKSTENISTNIRFSCKCKPLVFIFHYIRAARTHLLSSALFDAMMQMVPAGYQMELHVWTIWYGWSGQDANDWHGNQGSRVHIP